MRRTGWVALFVGIVLFFAHPLTIGAQPNDVKPSEAVPVIALVGGMLLDGYEAPPIHDAVVLVQGNRILAANKRSRVSIPNGALRIDTRGKTLLPGLIDLHVHLDLIGHGEYDDYYRFLGGTKRLPEILPIAAKQMLRAGVTSAIDLGTPWQILQTREQIRLGEIPGPRLQISGPWITRVSMDGIPPEYQLVVNSSAQARRYVKENARKGADVIKTWLGLTSQDLAEVVAEAHAQGLKVHTHLYEPDAMRLAIKAGVDVLQHVGSARTPAYPEDLVAMIAHRRIPVVQTVSHRIWVYPATLAFPTRLQDPRLQRDMPADIYAELQRSFQDLHRLSYFSHIGDEIRNAQLSGHQFIAAGAYMGVGTDAASPLNFHTEAMWREMAALVELGMTPIQAISAATKTGAEIMGRAAELGTLEPGKLADLIIVDGDPLTNINALKHVVATMSNGVVWYDAQGVVLDGVVAAGRAY